MGRISTGISELDTKLSGGYPEGKAILLTGTPGAGKTMFGLHFVQRSVIDGKKCIHIAAEESPEDILTLAEVLGLDLRPYLDSGQLRIERVFDARTESAEMSAQLGFGFETTEINLLEQVKLVPDDADAVVIDNVGVFALDICAKEFWDLLDTISRLLVMDEAAHNLTHGIAEYSAYGSIKLMMKENPYTGVRGRYLDIPKMRSTELSPELSVFDIPSEGIKIRKSKTKIGYGCMIRGAKMMGG
ncbi:MAG: ATPase domain-containing protein [Euryarchaeota archaeon]|nr:ATPase domain-containing protein [Euryarchaeota archaeon]